MQVTVTIPEEFAAQVQAQGVSPEHYIETWIASQVAEAIPHASQAIKLAELDVFLTEMAVSSESIPLFPDDAFTRENLYQDHD